MLRMRINYIILHQFLAENSLRQVFQKTVFLQREEGKGLFDHSIIFVLIKSTH